MITIRPTVFDKVDFDPSAIAALAAQARDLVVDQVPAATVLVDRPVLITVDEELSTSRVKVVGTDPISLAVESGALENYQAPRTLGETDSVVAFTRLFLEVVDRATPDFAAPSLDTVVPRAERMAWDVNLYGRVGRLGIRVHQPRFRYDFRNRHGFSDVADRAFDRLWSDDSLTWPQIVELSNKAHDPVNADHF